MPTIDRVIAKFIEAQQERLQRRTYRRYEDTMELFAIYLNSYGYMELDEEDTIRWEEYYGEDEEAFIKLFTIEQINSFQYGEFLEYFLIREVASSESSIKSAITVLRNFANWLYDDDYINPAQKADLLDYFKDGKSQSIPNAEKAANLLLN